MAENPVADIKAYEAGLYLYMDEHGMNVLENIRTTGQLSKEDEQTLKQILADYTKQFVK